MKLDLHRIRRLAIEDQLDMIADRMGGGGEAPADEADPFAGIGDEEDAEFADEVEEPAAAEEEAADEGPPAEEGEELPVEGEEPPAEEGEEGAEEGEGEEGEEGEKEEEEPPPPRTLMFDTPLPGKDPEHDKKPSDAWKYEDNLDSPMSRWLGGSDLERFAGMTAMEVYQNATQGIEETFRDLRADGLEAKNPDQSTAMARAFHDAVETSDWKGFSDSDKRILFEHAMKRK